MENVTKSISSKMEELGVWPELPQETNKEKCMETYWSLLQSIKSNTGDKGVTILKELRDTTACDHFKDLKNVRHEVFEQLGKDTINNLLHMAAPAVVDRNAVGKVDFTHAKDEVYNALDVKRQLKYHLTFNMDKIVIGTVLLGAGALALKSKSKGTIPPKL